MKTVQTPPITPQGNRLGAETIHGQSQAWISAIRFSIGEIRFLKGLMSSYLFEPKDSDAFQQVYDYRARLQDSVTALTTLCMDITCHQNKLGGALECQESFIGNPIREDHKNLAATYQEVMTDYQSLKLQVLSFASDVLNQNKATD